jgi:ubiquinone/menaquinone biosynthesis C-methylase UbiE
MSSGWKSSFNAKKYERFSSKYPTYKRTSRILVGMSGIRKGMTVVDLACGTGITTFEILKKLRRTGKVICIDYSKQMIHVAKGRIRAKNVSFIVSNGEDIDKAVDEKVDAVICNSAFWQMDIKKTLKGIGKVLKDDGVFAFSMGNTKPMVSELMIKHNNEIGKYMKSRKPFRPYFYSKSLRKSGFRVVRQKTVAIFNGVGEEREFMKIPVMTHRITEISYAKKLKLLDKTFKMLGPIKFKNTWTFIVSKVS